MTSAATAPVPPVSVAASPILTRDFPGWLPPMLVKELRQGLRTRGFVASLMGFQVVMLLFTLAAVSTQNVPTASARMGTAFSGVFWVVLAVQLLVVTPARGLGGLQAEIDTRTLDLLLLTRLTAWRVVLGKWFSLLAQGTLLLVAMLPYLAVRYFTENADIVEDAGRCLLMLLVSAVLTAAALWGSGVGKIVRVFMAIGLGFMLLQFFGAAGVLFGARPSAMRAGFLPGLDLPFDILNGVFLTAFFLVSAVRNIAPPAENHALFARILPLLALLPAPFAETFGAHALAVRQLYIAAGFLAFVLLFEFAAGRSPMPTHWREWYRRGLLSRTIGRFSLPGWQSVLLFAIAAAAFWAACELVIVAGSTSGSRAEAWRQARLVLLALSAVVFPAVMRSFLRENRFPPAIFYFFGLACPAILTVASLWLAEGRWRITGFRTVMETLPFSSFLLSVNRRTEHPPLIFAAQGIIAVLVIGLGLWRSRAYWRRLRTFEERDRADAATAAGNGVSPA